jgi:hypothetical protein
MLMKMKPKKEIEAYVKAQKINLVQSIRNMWAGETKVEFGLETFVESGSLSADKPLHLYADGATCAVEVIRRIQKKNPDEVPEGGARVEFVIVADHATPLVTKRARSIEETRENQLHLDEAHYTGVFDKKISGMLFAAYINEEIDQRIKNGSRTIDSFFGSADKGHIVPLMPPKKSDSKKEQGRLFVEKNLLGIGSENVRAEPKFINAWDKTKKKWVRREK